MQSINLGTDKNVAELTLNRLEKDLERNEEKQLVIQREAHYAKRTLIARGMLANTLFSLPLFIISELLKQNYNRIIASIGVVLLSYLGVVITHNKIRRLSAIVDQEMEKKLHPLESEKEQIEESIARINEQTNYENRQMY